MPNVLKSRKFWASVVAIAFVLLREFAPGLALDETQILGIVATVVAYITGVALEDGLSKRA